MTTRRNTSPGECRRGLGLSEHRGERGVSLEQIADRTKISIRFLRAIESEDFAVLPGGIFSKSYIRQYAAAVDYDADRLLERYRDCVGDADEDRRDTPRRGPDTEAGHRSPLQWFRAISAQKF